MTEAVVTVLSLIVIASLVFEIRLATDRLTHRQTILGLAYVLKPFQSFYDFESKKGVSRTLTRSSLVHTSLFIRHDYCGYAVTLKRTCQPLNRLERNISNM